MIRVGQIRLVAGREISERVRGKAIWVSTALTTALVVGFIVIPALVRAPARPVVIGLVGPGAQTVSDFRSDRQLGGRR